MMRLNSTNLLKVKGSQEMYDSDTTYSIDWLIDRLTLLKNDGATHFSIETTEESVYTTLFMYAHAPESESQREARLLKEKKERDKVKKKNAIIAQRKAEYERKEYERLKKKFQGA
jgi:hypothetical protein